jgi:hypothetical protein
MDGRHVDQLEDWGGYVCWWGRVAEAQNETQQKILFYFT